MNAMVPSNHKSIGFFLGVVVIVVIGLLVKAILFPEKSTFSEKSTCHVVFDAGSSGTRLFIYEEIEDGWREYKGLEVEPLADALDKDTDIDSVILKVVSTLDKIKQPSKKDKPGDPLKYSFDWSSQCDLASVQVYATAGMRIAEQVKPVRSDMLWQKLKKALKEKLGEVDVETRTLTGYEEGLFAWLAVYDERGKNKDFGIVEMGGASSQVTFPCPACDQSNDATRWIKVDGNDLKLYSYSFLGLGQKKARKILGIDVSCEYGVGQIDGLWKRAHCADTIKIKRGNGIRDPYNYGLIKRGTVNEVPIDKAGIKNWILTGAYFHSNGEGDVGECCKGEGNCPFETEYSCFRAVYLKEYLNALNIKVHENYEGHKSEASWTLGAVICQDTECMGKGEPLPPCRWLKNYQCLSE